MFEARVRCVGAYLITTDTWTRECKSVEIHYTIRGTYLHCLIMEVKYSNNASQLYNMINIGVNICRTFTSSPSLVCVEWCISLSFKHRWCTNILELQAWPILYSRIVYQLLRFFCLFVCCFFFTFLASCFGGLDSDLQWIFGGTVW